MLVKKQSKTNCVPNSIHNTKFPHASVPIGKDEEANVEVRRRDTKTFDFEIKIMLH